MALRLRMNSLTGLSNIKFGFTIKYGFQENNLKNISFLNLLFWRGQGEVKTRKVS